MDEKSLQFLKSLVFVKTGGYLEVIKPKDVTKHNQTCCVYNLFSNSYYIRLNLLEMEILLGKLRRRGFTDEWFVLEVILHEIAHWMQQDKYSRKHPIKSLLFKHPKGYQELEDQADRYAFYARKIIIRGIKQWTTLDHILNPS